MMKKFKIIPLLEGSEKASGPQYVSLQGFVLTPSSRIKRKLWLIRLVLLALFIEQNCVVCKPSHLAKRHIYKTLQLLAAPQAKF